MNDDISQLTDQQLAQRGHLDSTCRTAWFAPRCKNPDCAREWHGLPNAVCPGSPHFEGTQ